MIEAGVETLSARTWLPSRPPAISRHIPQITGDKIWKKRAVRIDEIQCKIVTQAVIKTIFLLMFVRSDLVGTLKQKSLEEWDKIPVLLK